MRKTLLAIGLSLALFGCANTSSETPTTQYRKTASDLGTVIGNPPPASTNTSSGNSGSVNQPLQGGILIFNVEGIGNHPRHICVPAKSKLKIRVIPHPNPMPLFPSSYKPTYPDGTIVYDGSAAYYTRLRVRVSIQGTPAAWDYVAYNDVPSVIGDYSSYLNTGNPSSSTTPSSPSYLSTPEYTGVWILGSDPYDGSCTYWENQLGKCSAISSILLDAETAGCKTGEQKLLISKIVSDYPCQNDKIGWCKGASMQIVPDYQRWNITVQAVTESTKEF